MDDIAAFITGLMIGSLLTCIFFGFSTDDVIQDNNDLVITEKRKAWKDEYRYRYEFYGKGDFNNFGNVHVYLYSNKNFDVGDTLNISTTTF